MDNERVREVLVLAAADPAAQRYLWENPEQFGRDHLLEGTDLAELVGTIRYRKRRRETTARDILVVEAAILHEMGRPWPFVEVADAELRSFVEVTESISAFIIRATASGILLSRELCLWYRSWGEALLQDASKRAAKQVSIDTNIADTIVAARNLLAALHRQGGSEPV